MPQRRPFFEQNADRLMISRAPTEQRLRDCQREALLSIGAFVARSRENALLVLPTGAGKSFVLLLAPLLLRSKRALIVVPNTTIRGQLAVDLQDLSQLTEQCDLRSLRGECRVHEVEQQLGTTAKWRELRRYDLVVGTPHCLSPAHEGVVDPPDPSLFDLVMFDEAHHLPAPTWLAMNRLFQQVPRFGLTATPFRADGQRIPGEIIYRYSIAKAIEDGVIGTVEYRPVDAAADGADEALARAALACWQERRETDRLLVKAANQATARTLAELYRSLDDGLRIAPITSGDQRAAKAHIEELRNGELHGAVVVEMLGEGFNVPSLNIAALHATPQSLGPLLQFVGRLVRRVDGQGPAVVLARPGSLSGPASVLLEHDADWARLVPALFDAHVDAEVEVQQMFRDGSYIDLDPTDFGDLQMDGLAPRFHVRIYDSAGAALDLQGLLQPDAECFERRTEMIRGWTSADGEMVAAVTRLRQPVSWHSDPRLVNVRFDYHILYRHVGRELLFVITTQRDFKRYDALIGAVSGTELVVLAQNHVDRIMGAFSELKLHGLGLASRQPGGGQPGYQTHMGQDVASDLNLALYGGYNRSHQSGTALDPQTGERSGIGGSRTGKLWSTRREDLRVLRQWCDQLAEVYAGDGAAPVNKAFLLPASQQVTCIPEAVIAVEWNEAVWHGDIEMVVEGVIHPLADAADLELPAAGQANAPLQLAFRLAEALEPGVVRAPVDIVYNPAASPLFTVAEDPSWLRLRESGDEWMTLAEWLNLRPPKCYTVGGGALIGREYQPGVAVLPAAFPDEQLRAVDWAAADVDRSREFDDDVRTATTSIHGYLWRQLPSEYEAVFYDHGTGEMADFIAMRLSEDGPFAEVEIHFFHCKGAADIRPETQQRDVFADLSEVVNQAVRSVRWNTISRIQDALRTRQTERQTPSEFVCGAERCAELLAGAQREWSCRYQVHVVQPGVIRSAGLSAQQNLMLAGADAVLRAALMGPLVLWCSP